MNDLHAKKQHKTMDIIAITKRLYSWKRVLHSFMHLDIFSNRCHTGYLDFSEIECVPHVPHWTPVCYYCIMIKIRIKILKCYHPAAADLAHWIHEKDTNKK